MTHSVDRARTDADAQFRALFEDEFSTMFRLAALLGARDPENIAQEAFARLHERWATLADASKAGGYLRTTVVNLARSAGRRHTVARRVLTTTLAPHPDDDRVDSAELLALQRISDTAMLTALNDLAPRHREALVLRFWLDLSEAQMAEAMGCSTGTVKSHVSRGLSALRAALTIEGEKP